MLSSDFRGAPPALSTLQIRPGTATRVQRGPLKIKIIARLFNIRKRSRPKSPVFSDTQAHDNIAAYLAGLGRRMR